MKANVKRLTLAGLLALGMGVSLLSSAPASTALAGKIGCNGVQENGSSWEAVNGELDEMGGPKNGAGLGSIEQPIPPGNPEGCFGTNGPMLDAGDPPPPPTPKPVTKTGAQIGPGTTVTNAR